jgi:anthranilate synthase/aminodeoxychorismate synthase-like glutamine amidotransferase
MTRVILLVDNYDSFVHNLARYLRRLGQETRVVRNDAVRVADIRRSSAQAVVLSPGPGTPQEAGLSLDIVRELYSELPLLGVCLGHQIIAAAFGASVVRAEVPMHGRTSDVFHSGQGLFAGLPNPFRAARYHSLVVEGHSLPDELVATAHTADGILMAIEHREFPVVGWQFHPESILTDQGYPLLAAFLQRGGLAGAGGCVSLADEYCSASQPLQLQPAGPLTY